ncbi:MAG: S1C family serine protease, partial [Simkaniaceae bacterium]|nr:S1C family serine protease [Simkaniaceae bacterium]
MKNTIVNIATFISLSLSAPMQASIFNFFSSDDKSEEKQQVVTQETPSQANPQLAYTADNSDPLIAAGRNQMPPCDRSRDNSALSNGNEGINYAKLLTRTFSNVAKKAIPSVVFIKTEVPAEADYGQMNPFADDFFYRFFGGTPPKQRNQPYNTPPMQIAQGSGFIITKDGYIMTNYHVVKDSTKITVDLNDKENSQYEAEFVGGDPQTDIALIKITGKEDFPYLELEDINNVEVGEWAIAIGNPFDLEASVTVGVVSAKGRND